MNFSVPTRLSRRTAWLVLALWVLTVGILTSLAPSLDAVKGTDDDNPPSDSMSMQAEALARDAFGGDGAPPAVLVFRSGAATTTHEAVERVTSAIEAAELPHVAAVQRAEAGMGAEGFVADDGRAEMVVVQMSGSPGEDGFRDAVTRLRELADREADAVGPGVEVDLTGPAGISVDAVKVFSGSDKVLLFGTIGLVIVLLGAIYRSPGLVAVSLIGVGFAMRVAEGVGALLADAGWIEISGQTASVMTVLLFGVGTDYALIIFSRYREALAAHPDPTVAVAAAMRGVYGALLASVSTIVAAVLALLAAVSPTLHAFGPYLAVGVVSMAVVAFTLTPALLVLLGRFALWPRGASRPGEGRAWARVADLVVERPRRVLAVGLAGLALLGTGLVGSQQSFDLVDGFRIDTESASGRTALAASFGPGTVAPSQVLVHAHDPLSDEQVRAVVDGVAGHERVASTGAVRTAAGARTLSVDAVLDVNPYGSRALDAVPDLRRAVEAATRDAGVRADVLIGGETSKAADTRSALERDLVVVGLLMLAAVALILGLVLRSVLAPVYLVLTLLLSYVAAMGLTAFLAMGLGGDSGFGNRVAVYVLVFLVALGVDYTIFMMTRFRQELRHAEPVDALRSSIVRTGGVISSAGVILAGTFGVLMTQPIRELFQFGLAMAIGILLDTFVVRPLLVPTLIRLLGRHALWPTRLSPAPPSESFRSGTTEQDRGVACVTADATLAIRDAPCDSGDPR
ncbi:MMPL family transporter [Nocardioides alcanivorans]|uniref:MMPL family transporter n=1 Tax=Nocardioides alcanivorans TaxID=2897352 RepID=UPI001F2570F0|nr:MMPL family transporter [Nocardioides alcanivorans]